MTNAEQLSILAANLRYAAHTREQAKIGRGIFSPADMKAATDEIRRLQALSAKIDTAARLGFSAWCDEWGYSPDQITAHTHYSAARALGE